MNSNQAPTAKNCTRITRCAQITVGIIVVMLIGALIRVGQLKLDPQPELRVNQGARLAKTYEPRYRGTVFDRTGRTLSIDRPAWRLAIDPSFYFEHGHNRLTQAETSNSTTTDNTFDLTFDDELTNLVGPLALAREHLRATRFHHLARSLSEKIQTSHQDIYRTLITAKPSRRYLVLERLLKDWQVDVTRTWIKNQQVGVILEQRTVRAYFGPPSLEMIVGKVRDNGKGGSGLEQDRNKTLESSAGILTTRRTAAGKVLSVPGGSYQPGAHGSDFVLTIDAHIQSIVAERLAQQLEKVNAGGGRCLVIDPQNGDILAMVDLLRRRDNWEEAILDDPLRRIEPSLARNRNLVDAFEPGSTFKPFVWAGAVEAGVGSSRPVPRTATGKVNVNIHRIKVPGRRNHIEDAGNSPYRGPIDDIETILVRSLNTGMIEMVRPLSNTETRDILVRFGFGKRTQCGIVGSAEHPGQVTALKNWTYANTSVSVSFGHEVAVTTPQMARAFSTFCTGGLMPQLRIVRPQAATEGHNMEAPARALMTRVLSQQVANRTKQALRRAVTERRGTLNRYAQSDSYTMFGKSGTADLPNPKGGYFKDRHTSNVIAAAPFEYPRIVVYCVIDDPDKSIAHYGGKVAGPVVRDVIDATLRYQGIPADKEPFEQPNGSRIASDGRLPTYTSGE